MPKNHSRAATSVSAQLPRGQQWRILSCFPDSAHSSEKLEEVPNFSVLTMKSQYFIPLLLSGSHHAGKTLRLPRTSAVIYKFCILFIKHLRATSLTPADEALNALVTWLLQQGFYSLLSPSVTQVLSSPPKTGSLRTD